jgi:hypothetical protein
MRRLSTRPRHETAIWLSTSFLTGLAVGIWQEETLVGAFAFALLALGASAFGLWAEGELRKP